MESTPAIFIDRDGVINENRPDHVKSWSEFRFLPGSLTALRMLADASIPIVGVTNQAIIRRGIVSERDIDGIHRRMLSQIEAASGRIDRMYFCPHRPEEGCDCRKPQPGMLLTASRDLNLDLEKSILIGDAFTDIEAGRQAGCKTVLVLSGRTAIHEIDDASSASPDAVADDLLHAIPEIFSMLKEPRRRVTHRVA